MRIYQSQIHILVTFTGAGNYSVLFDRQTHLRLQNAAFRAHEDTILFSLGENFSTSKNIFLIRFSIGETTSFAIFERAFTRKQVKIRKNTKTQLSQQLFLNRIYQKPANLQ